jgi:hypothetical protein
MIEIDPGHEFSLFPTGGAHRDFETLLNVRTVSGIVVCKLGQITDPDILREIKSGGTIQNYTISKE